ncbi:hypothetical protein [Geobacter sp.]|uniref:hypothetical protein n=1 Tax=Geobacter sp. TaxID=46610 RepID=UPI0027BAE440|nr:hypothetical protein [Geobacter sp.]
MDFDGLVPYLLVAALVFLIPKLVGRIGKGKHEPTFVPHYTYVAAGIVLAGIVLYFAVKIIAAVVGG